MNNDDCREFLVSRTVTGSDVACGEREVDSISASQAIPRAVQVLVDAAEHVTGCSGG